MYFAAVGLPDHFERIVKLVNALAMKTPCYECVNAGGEGQNDDGKCRPEPQRQPQAHASADQVHGISSRATNPMPRTVWISFRSKGSSTLRRRRAM